jgi:hypothetical protein
VHPLFFPATPLLFLFPFVACLISLLAHTRHTPILLSSFVWLGFDGILLLPPCCIVFLEA